MCVLTNLKKVQLKANRCAPNSHGLTIQKIIAVFLFLAAAFSVHAQQRVWGVTGDPNSVDYAGWSVEENNIQMKLLKELGATHYRIAFHDATHPESKRIFNLIHASANAEGIKLLPIIFTTPRPEMTYQENYQRGYDEGVAWARHVREIKPDGTVAYKVSHWELGNETSNAKVEKDGRKIPMFRLVDQPGKRADGSDPRDWDEAPEFKGQAFPAMAGVLRGLYWGIKDTYGTAEVKILFGDVWRGFGYVERIATEGGINFFPGDILSWHWYTPSFGGFSQEFTNQWGVTRSPYNYAASIRPGITPPGTKIDIWMTEVGREDCPLDAAAGCAPPKVGGSAMNRWNPDGNWELQSQEMSKLLQELLSPNVPQVKGIFAYELYDKYLDKLPYSLRAETYPEFTSQGFYGLVQRTRTYPRLAADMEDYVKKPVFYTFGSFARNYR